MSRNGPILLATVETLFIDHSDLGLRASQTMIKNIMTPIQSPFGPTADFCTPGISAYTTCILQKDLPVLLQHETGKQNFPIFHFSINGMIEKCRHIHMLPTGMGKYSMENEGHWKNKYLANLEQMEDFERRLNEAEDLMRLTVARLR